MTSDSRTTASRTASLFRSFQQELAQAAGIDVDHARLCAPVDPYELGDRLGVARDHDLLLGLGEEPDA
jgi:hypothetical protein